MVETQLWVEKYRPKTLDDVVNHNDIIKAMKTYVKEENIPNMLLVGPAGVGKTASALAMAHDLYGDDYKEYTLEMNASDERGIDMVREDLKDFSRSIPSGEESYKILILDEADHLTSEAQHALRRTMEKYSDLTRYILIGNYSSKIIEPIQSRCSLFSFSHLSKEKVKERLSSIADQEGLEIKEDGFQALLEVSRGDLRKAINLLQSIAYGEKVIDREKVYSAAGEIYPETAKKLITMAFDGNFEKARTKLTNALIEQGVDGTDLLKALEREINHGVVDIDSEDKMQLTRLISELDFRITQGATAYIQLTSFLVHLYELGEKYRK